MWPFDGVINIVPARKCRTSVSDIDTFLHGEKIRPYYWNPNIKSKEIWNTEIVIVWRILYGHMKFVFMQKRTKNGLVFYSLTVTSCINQDKVSKSQCSISGVGWRLNLPGISCHVSCKQTGLTINHAPLCPCNYFMLGPVYLYILNAEWWKCESSCFYFGSIKI